MTPAPTELRHRVDLRTKIFFGVGEFATATKGYAMHAFLLFYYTQVLGLEGWLTGFALGIAIVFDAVNDPIVGSVSDNWRSSLGRRHPLMWISLVPMCITFYYLWIPPEGLGQYALFAWLTVFAVLARSFMTFFQIPHNALGAELSPDYSERSRIWGFAQLFGWLGGGSFGAFAYIVVFKKSEAFENGLLNPAAYPDLAMLGVLYIFIGITLSTAFTQRAARALPEIAAPKEGFSFRRLHREGKQALQNKNFRVLFFGILLGGAIGGIGGTLALHMQTYFWGLLPAQIIYFIAAGFTVNMLVFIGIQTIAARFEKKKLLIGLSIFAMVDSITVISARLMGWLPDNGDPLLLPIIVTTYALGTAAGAITHIVARSMIADVVDEQEVVTGERQEGMFYSALAFSGKAVSGVGAMTGGFVLSAIQFPSNVDATGVSADVVFRMGVFMGPILSALYLIPIGIYVLYHLDRVRHAEIQQVLHERRQARVEPASASLAAAGGD
ncbi:MAG: MFS transporter [Deltaproteobacteria bacterium]|nr:MFS transporter [Deltaproteobacteria bacterium]MBW2413237.1 MFS transporter [Deltaproteobacteria bacterium]